MLDGLGYTRVNIYKVMGAYRHLMSQHPLIKWQPKGKVKLREERVNDIAGFR